MTAILREVELATHLQHRGILPLHDSGQAGGEIYRCQPTPDGRLIAGTRIERREEIWRMAIAK